MTLTEIADYCNRTLNAKASEYATPEERWHNFYQPCLYDTASTPCDWVTRYAMKHKISCEDITAGVRQATKAQVLEKGGDLICYYLIMKCLQNDKIEPKTLPWIEELLETPHPFWSVGLDLLLEVN